MAEVLLQKSIEETVRFPHVQFAEFEHQDMEDLSFFTEDEIHAMKLKIRDAQEDGKHSGGKYILKQLQSVEYAKRDLLKFVENIREALKPRVVVRPAKVNVQEVIDSTTEKAVRDATYTFKLLPDKTLRDVGRAVIGDVEEDYTVDELSHALAVKQITGRLIDPGE